MKRLVKWTLVVVAALWAVFTFIANVSPDEAMARTGNWFALPLVRSLPGFLASLATSPVTLSLTFLLAGIWLGWRLRKWASELKPPYEGSWRQLADEMSDMGYAIENLSIVSSSPATISALNVLKQKLALKGFAVPQGGPLDRENAALYMHQVSAFLKAGDLERAMWEAKRIAALPPSSPMG